MQVDEFAIGFGPKIYSCTYGSTLYSLRAVPLGGFNRIAGMTEDEPLNERSFLNKPVPSRLLVIAAGGIMNFLLAILILWGVTFAVGTMTVSPQAVVGSVIENSAASQADMQEGDRIVSIGGTAITQWSDISQAVAEHSRSVVTVVVERDGKELSLDMIPQVDSQSQRATLGIMPVITKQSHLDFTAFLSINLGILNLLPIPLLDGGYIILLILEGISGRRMPKKALQYIQATGMVILGALFLFAMFQDISRF